MKVLIPYDGSEAADAALEELRHAGLPEQGVHGIIATVAEPELRREYAVPAMTADPSASRPAAISPPRTLGMHYGEQSVPEIDASAEWQLRTSFPDWKVTSVSRPGIPVESLLEIAEQTHPDLLVIGSHRHGLLSRLLFGSVSQDLVNRAPCSVRVARPSLYLLAGPQRLVIGVDGSEDSMAAVRLVARRNWAAGTKVWVVGVSTPHPPEHAYVDTGYLPHKEVPETSEFGRILHDCLDTAVTELTAAGLDACAICVPGGPVHALIRAAEELEAGCIFLGARGHGALYRLVVGSVAAGVAARAECSVEIVRPAES